MGTGTASIESARTMGRSGAWSATGVVIACAASAGVHLGLVPAHLQSEPREGVAFIVTTVVLLALAGALTVRPGRAQLTAMAALVLAALMCAYAATRISGIPWLAPDREPFDALGAVTNVVEAAGLVLALHRLHRRDGRPHRRQLPQEGTP